MTTENIDDHDFSNEMFEQKLVEFFERQDPEKISIVPEIVEKFSNDQDTVFKHLSKLYAAKNGVLDVKVTNSNIFSVPGSANSGYIG